MSSLALRYFWLITLRLNANLVLRPFMCISSSQYEIRVTEINDCEHGRTFSSDQIHSGIGQCILFVLLMSHRTTLQWVPQLSWETVTRSAVALLIPGGRLAIPSSSPNASSHHTHAWLRLQSSRGERAALLSSEKNVYRLLCRFSNQPFSLLSCLLDRKGNGMFYLM